MSLLNKYGLFLYSEGVFISTLQNNIINNEKKRIINYILIMVMFLN